MAPHLAVEVYHLFHRRVEVRFLISCAEPVRLQKGIFDKRIVLEIYKMLSHVFEIILQQNFLNLLDVVHESIRTAVSCFHQY